MRVVLDTNAFLSCIGKRSPYRNVFDAFLNARFDLCISTEILLEYEEKFIDFWGVEVAQNLLGVILTSENVVRESPFFHFGLVQGDEDANKFADIYISGGADILVSNDKKILAIDENGFPPVKTMTLQAFSRLLIDKDK
ncbi:MAG: putative toxin-antitoxin system toxin component, PIN family [Flavobacteriales bacterium]|nr:putative toxin-antitoxin system toxin component, PIN family [Flavobacteriales bacterium]